MSETGQVGDHLGALGGVVEQGPEGLCDVGCSEVVLKELGDDASTSDEVDHGDGEVATGVQASGPDFGRVVDETLG